MVFAWMAEAAIQSCNITSSYTCKFSGVETVVTLGAKLQLGCCGPATLVDARRRNISLCERSAYCYMCACIGWQSYLKHTTTEGLGMFPRNARKKRHLNSKAKPQLGFRKGGKAKPRSIKI
eukprot:TRINITY_DN63766_c0_g1_i1.p2 TRINITY_DN63766_c0_g1~~TRINITY_DN63766_c0_g1_i1.p2  ORF type:complete len:121 (-),score=9.38 TRINITY_DN63766_c0_g1_i1:377-739(-)